MPNTGRQTIHVTLATEAAARCRAHTNESLRDWLLGEYARITPIATQPATLFSSPIEVAEEVPLLLAALSQLTGRSADDFIETWALQLPAEADAPAAPLKTAEVRISAEQLGQLAEILDLGETFFEDTVADARQRLGGSYPDGDKAEEAAAQIFQALRMLLGLLPPANDHQPK